MIDFFRRALLKAKFRIVFGTPEGREVLDEICRSCQLHKSTFVVGRPDLTAYRNGQRDVALSLLRMIGEDNPKQVSSMTEALQNQQQKDNQDES